METKEDNKNFKIIKITVLILAIIILLFTVILCYIKFFTNSEKQETISLEEQISDYEGEECYGDEVKMLLAKIMDNNISNSEVQKLKSNLQKIEFNIKTSDDEVISGTIELEENFDDKLIDIVKLKNNINKEEKYNVTYEYEDEKIISISINN